MTTFLTVNSAFINYVTGSTECQCCVVVDVPTLGRTYLAKSVSLSNAKLSPDWTDAELCEAVADALELDRDEVSVAQAPAPVAAEPEAAESE